MWNARNSSTVCCSNSSPHQKHIPPDIKHQRVPAPQLYFTQPSLPFLIQEIEQLLKGDE